MARVFSSIKLLARDVKAARLMALGKMPVSTAREKKVARIVRRVHNDLKRNSDVFPLTRLTGERAKSAKFQEAYAAAFVKLVEEHAKAGTLIADGKAKSEAAFLKLATTAA